jgi:hypothetical protein
VGADHLDVAASPEAGGAGRATVTVAVAALLAVESA